jgi:hypothetical protein
MAESFTADLFVLDEPQLVAVTPYGQRHRTKRELRGIAPCRGGCCPRPLT